MILVCMSIFIGKIAIYLDVSVWERLVLMLGRFIIPFSLCFCNDSVRVLHFKVKKVSPEGSKAKSKRDASHITIPTHFVQFLLESSPAAELLCLEMPNVRFLLEFWRIWFYILSMTNVDSYSSLAVILGQRMVLKREHETRSYYRPRVNFCRSHDLIHFSCPVTDQSKLVKRLLVTLSLLSF